MSHELAPNTFVAESRDLLHDMEEALLALEHSADQADAVTAAFRAMHTIKGSAGVFGFDVIVEFAHAMEEVIEEVRAGRVAVDDVLVALLLSCADHVGGLVDCLQWDDRLERLDTARAQGRDLLQQLECYRNPAVAAPAFLPPVRQAQPRTGSDPTPPDDATCNDCWHVSVRFQEDALRHGMDPLALLRYLSTIGTVRSVVPLFDAMPGAQAMDPQACYVGLELQFNGDASRQDLEDALEYVREVASVRMLPPHAPLASYVDLLAAAPEGQDRLGDCLVQGGTLSREELAALRQLAAAELAPAGPGAQVAPGQIAPEATQRGAGDGRGIRVRAGKLDELIDLVGELVIAGAGVSLCAQRAADADVREAVSTMGRLVEQVRDAALGLRMVPVGETFARFKRVVHDLGRDLGKEVDLVISGADTELDKSMVEKLSDPLMHLVRNALDHGIEPPAVRLARGKPVRGQLRLDAYHESGSIVIAISDDGAGFDPQRITARAVERGLVAEGAILGDRELLQLVMEPGFSTASEVTSVSGRGMGMDVVRRNLESLRGSVSVDSVPGQGTAVALRAPLTLAIIDGFLVGVGDATFVVPLEMVVECIELAQASGTASTGYINLRGDVLPLLRLRELFDVGGQAARRENIVVVQYAGAQAGLVVDALMGEFQTVIKPLGRLFERLAGISGSTILGSGEVALILDVQGLIGKVLQTEESGQARPTLMKTSGTDKGPGAPEAPLAAPTFQ